MEESPGMEDLMLAQHSISTGREGTFNQQHNYYEHQGLIYTCKIMKTLALIRTCRENGLSMGKFA